MKLEKKDFINIAILATIIFVIGVYLIASTVLISRDGTLYIDSAKKLTANNFLETVRTMRACPLHPFLISMIHKTCLFGGKERLQEWIISAQAVSLLSKLVASITLYFIGSILAGRKAAFWGVLILCVLPDSAEYGSDAIPEWPHLMFLSIGFLLLLWGTQYRKSWMFGLAGIAAGLGYLIRSESCQLILYGGMWLIFNLVRPEGKMRRPKAFAALILLAAGFAVVAVPYMKLKGYVFPDQGIMKLSTVLRINDDDNADSAHGRNMCIAGIPSDKVKGNKTLTKNICETLVYYFVPGLVIGCWYYFRKQSKITEQVFYPAVFIITNIAILLWQISHRHFLSRRYSLALIAFTAFCIPIGIEIIADWISKRMSKSRPIADKDRQHWFYILLFIGIMLCLLKLAKRTDLQKYGYRDVAIWLNKNTTSEDVIAVPDKRIIYYAERNGIEYSKKRKISKYANYIVRVVKNEDVTPDFSKEMEEQYSAWVNKKKKEKLVVYRVLR